MLQATRYNLTATKGQDYRVQLTVKMYAGTVGDAVVSSVVFARHSPNGAAVCTSFMEVIDADSGLVEFYIPGLETDKLDPNVIYAYQIEGQPQDGTPLTLAHGRFYVNPRYSEGGGTA